MIFGLAEKWAVPQGHIMQFIVEGFVDLCSVVLTLDHYSGSGTGSYYYMPHKTTSCTGTYFVVVVAVRRNSRLQKMQAHADAARKLFLSSVPARTVHTPETWLTPLWRSELKKTISKGLQS